MNKCKLLFSKYREPILYILFGIATTALNLAVYFILCRVFGERFYLIANCIAWVAGVAFAYVTNKIYVFNSRSWAPRVLLRECAEFVAARLFSLAVEEAGLFLMIHICRFDLFAWDLILLSISGTGVAKIITSVIVVILNYIFSKLIIFKKSSGGDPPPPKQ